MSAPPTDKEIARTWAERLVVALDLVSVGSVLKLHCVQEHILSALVQAREQDKKGDEKCPFCNLRHNPEKSHCNDPRTGALIRRRGPIESENKSL